ncbi:hypothetical protein HN00_09685 [Limosilactobacillus reuteri]|nr:hypothetical protein HN00_09685 [Limosilactobacillus reuteri]
MKLIETFFQSSLNYGGSWYFSSCILGIIIVDFCVKRNLMRILNSITIVLFILENINSTYYYLFRPFSYFAKPGEFCLMFLTGIVWINISYYIVKYETEIMRFGILNMFF